MDKIERKIALVIDKVGISYFKLKRKEFESNPLYKKELDLLFFDPSNFSLSDHELQVVLSALRDEEFIIENENFKVKKDQILFDQIYNPFQMDYKNYCLFYQINNQEILFNKTALGLLEMYASNNIESKKICGTIWMELYPIQELIEEHIAKALSMGGKSITNIIDNIIIKIEALVHKRLTNPDWDEFRDVYKYYLEKLEIEAHKRFATEISLEVYSESTAEKLEFGISKVALVSLIDLLLKCDILPNQKAALKFCHEHFSFKDGKAAKAISLGKKSTLTTLYNDITNKKDMGGFYDIKEMLLDRLSKIPDRPKKSSEDS
jgi:hypothetical protein